MHRDVHGRGLAILLNKPAEAGLEQTNAAKSAGRVGENCSSAFWADPWSAYHFSLCRSFPISLYCPKIVPRSRLQNRNEMPELVFDIGRYCDGVRDLLA